MSDFHFLRPVWFWGLSALLLLPLLIVKNKNNAGKWAEICDAFLLQAQLIVGTKKRTFLTVFLLGLSWLIAIVALAGPTWQRLPQPVMQKSKDVVFLLDVSSPMFATDVKPSRIDRARFKIEDFLEKRPDNQSALVLYADKPFTAVPLTSDRNVVKNILPSIEAGLMGNSMPDLSLALKKALELLKGAKSTKAQIVVLTGFVDKKDLEKAVNQAEALKKQGHSVSVLGIGTKDKVPLQRPDGSFFMSNGKPVLSALKTAELKEIAKQGGGLFQQITINDKDVNAILDLVSVQQPTLNLLEKMEKENNVKADTWKDFGGVLCVFILPFALLAFRKGWFYVLIWGCFMQSVPAHAWELNDLWTRPERKEALRLYQGQNVENIEAFKNNAEWLGVASYKAKDYSVAVEALKTPENITMQYNQGNALAQAGQYQEAIKAYENVLKQNPKHKDAAFNKKYIEDELKKNQNNQDKQDNKNQENQKNQQDKSEQQQNQQNQQQKNQQENQQQNQEQNQKQQSQESQSEQQQNQQNQQQQQNQQGQNNNSAESQPDQKDNAKDKENGNGQSLEKTKQDKERQEQMQWLSVIEDNPSGLLRERIRRYNIRNQRSR